MVELTDLMKATLASEMSPKQVVHYIGFLRLQGFGDDEIVKLIVESKPGSTAADPEAFTRQVLADCDARQLRLPIVERENLSQQVEIFINTSAPTLTHYAGDFIAFNDEAGCYETIPKLTVESEVRKFLTNCRVVNFDKKTNTRTTLPFHPLNKDVNELVSALAGYRHYSPLELLPQWLPYDGPQPEPLECIAFRNGILHTTTREFIDKTEAYLNRNALDFDFDADAPAPVLWLVTLKQYWPDEDQQDCIDTLQEFTGYLLTSDTSYQKAPSSARRRSGKGLISRVIRCLVGASNSVSTSLNSLGGEFGMSPLIAKLFALVGETKFGNKVDRTEVTRRLLSIIGEDGVDINRKNKDYWDGVKLAVRFMLLGNEVPRFDDAAGAMAARLIILKMTASFDGKEDPTLEARLIAELPGILLWALDGLKAAPRAWSFRRAEI